MADETKPAAFEDSQAGFYTDHKGVLRDKDGRMVKICKGCGQVRGIYSKGYCDKCRHGFTAWLKEKEEHRKATMDLHSPGIKKEQKKIFRAFNTVMGGLADLKVSDKDIMDIRLILNIYVEPIAKWLKQPTDGEVVSRAGSRKPARDQAKQLSEVLPENVPPIRNITLKK